MSQVSYGTITINDLTDITDVYLEYALVSDTITRAEDIPSSTQWSTTYPTWVSGQQIWIRRVTYKKGIDTPEYGTPYLDKAVSQIQNNYIGLSNKLRTFFYPGDLTYSGAFAVSKTSTDGLDTANANTYGFNARVASALISMGYNKIPLLEMGLLGNNFNGIKLYSPILTNNVITGNRLDATLTSDGLKLLKGGIEAGTFNSNDYIYVWSNDDNNHTIKIGNSSNNKNDWRIIAGNKFGVDKAGNLYASNADITGAITATSLIIGSGATVSGLSTSNISGINNYALQSSLDTEVAQRKAVYAVSTTGATTAAKTTESGTPSGFVLYNGATVTIKFNSANSTTTPTLNVNGTGAKTIKSYTGAALTAAEYTWPAGAVITFTYDGSYWRMQDGASYSVEVKVDSISYANNSATLVAIPYYKGSTTLPSGVTHTYQWYKGTQLLSNKTTAPTIGGATTATLTLGAGSDLNALYVCIISK